MLKTNKILACTVMIVLLNINISMADAIYNKYCNKYSSIRIYFVRWNIMTRVALTPSTVREWRHLYMEINEEHMIIKIADAVFRDKFNKKNPEPSGNGPANLVIDFVNYSGSITTVYANNSYMVNMETNMYKMINNDMINNITSIFYIKGK